MFEHIHFDVDIERKIFPGRLRWPSARQAQDGSGFGGNRDYYDLRGQPWSDVGNVLREELELIARIEQAENPDEESELIEEEFTEDPGGLMGLDIGVASTVAALSAAGAYRSPVAMAAHSAGRTTNLVRSSPSARAASICRFCWRLQSARGSDSKSTRRAR